MKTSFDGGPKDGGPEFVSGPPPVLGPLRTCTKCGEVKTLDEYHKKSMGKMGWDAGCKVCRAKVVKEWDSKNKSRRSKTNKDWYQRNKRHVLALAKEWREDNPERHLENSKKWRKNNPERYKKLRDQNYHKRRALVAGAEVSSVDLAELWTGWCALCGGAMDYDLKYPDPMSKSLDHDVPLSLGGSHSKDNLQWTHLSCNISKGANV